MKAHSLLVLISLLAAAALACGVFSTPTPPPAVIATFGQPGPGQVQAPSQAAPQVAPPAAGAASGPALEPGWTTALCTPAQVQLGVPPGFTVKEYIDTGQLFLHDESRSVSLEFMCVPADHGGTFQSEMAWWRDFQKNVQWGGWTQDSTAIGPMGWAEGPNTNGDPIFGAVLGPTRNGHILQLWAMAPEADWETARETFLKVLHSVQYAS